MKKTFTANEIKRFAEYSKDISDDAFDTMDYSKLDYVNEIWGIIWETMDKVNYDLSEGKSLTLNMKPTYIEYMTKVSA